MKTLDFDCLLEAVIKYATIDPESIEGHVLLKDMVINQLIPHIRKKLQNIDFDLDSKLQTLAKLPPYDSVLGLGESKREKTERLKSSFPFCGLKRNRTEV